MSTERGPYTTAPGPRRTWGGLTLWAEDGLVVTEDKENGEIAVLSVKESEDQCKDHAKVLDIYDKKKSNPASGDPTERAYAIEYYRHLRGWLENLTETIRDAKQQGDQNDPEVRKRLLIRFLREKRAGQGREGGRDPVSLLFTQDFGRPLMFGSHTSPKEATKGGIILGNV